MQGLNFLLYSVQSICYTWGMTDRAVVFGERDRLLRELGGLSEVLHGSWVERYSTCTRAGCACHRGKRHGPRHYLVVNTEGRQRQRYVPARLAGAVHRGLAQHRRLLEIVRRLTELNLTILRAGADGPDGGSAAR